MPNDDDGCQPPRAQYECTLYTVGHQLCGRENVRVCVLCMFVTNNPPKKHTRNHMMSRTSYIQNPIRKVIRLKVCHNDE